MNPPPLVAVAHGTRNPVGPVVLDELLDRVRSQLPDVEVLLSYVDVIGPMLEDVLRELGDDSSVVVPLFLASGYHVRVDVPQAVEMTGGHAVVTPALGPDDAVIAVVAERLFAAGPTPDSVVLAAAGSSDGDALAEVETASRRLSSNIKREVTPAYVTTAAPAVPDAVAAQREKGASSVGIASYLLAPGLFQARLLEAGADVVGDSIGAHDAVADLIVSRYQASAVSTG